MEISQYRLVVMLLLKTVIKLEKLKGPIVQCLHETLCEIMNQQKDQTGWEAKGGILIIGIQIRPNV